MVNLFPPQNVVVVDTIRKELLPTSGIPDSWVPQLAPSSAGSESSDAMSCRQ